MVNDEQFHFKARPVKASGVWRITIPMRYVTDGHIDPRKEYEVSLFAIE